MGKTGAFSQNKANVSRFSYHSERGRPRPQTRRKARSFLRGIKCASKVSSRFALIAGGGARAPSKKARKIPTWHRRTPHRLTPAAAEAYKQQLKNVVS